MINSVSALLGVAGIAVTGLAGIALGQYAVSGIDPTKAAAYDQAGYARLAASVPDDSWTLAAPSDASTPLRYASYDGDRPRTPDLY